MSLNYVFYFFQLMVLRRSPVPEAVPRRKIISKSLRSLAFFSTNCFGQLVTRFFQSKKCEPNKFIKIME